MPSFSVYFSEYDRTKLLKFQEILKREGTNVSHHIMEYIFEYVDIHDPGNPQTRVTSFANGGELTTASIEGKIRQYFFERSKKTGQDIMFKDILTYCRDHFSSPNEAMSISQRIRKWLISKGVRVWR